MEDLITFLRNQLDADDREADGSTEPFLHGDRTGMDGLHPQIRMHLYRWTPARVKPHIAAMRAIAETHYIIERKVNWTDAEGDERQDNQPVCVVCVEKYSAVKVPDDLGPCRTVRLLASAYADQPGFRSEWLTE